MSKNKSPQIARECTRSYVGYLRDKRIIPHVIVERVSNMKSKQTKAVDNSVMNVTTPALNTSQRKIPQCSGLNVGPHIDMDGL